MDNINASAQVKADVQVLPTHSQVFLVAVTVLVVIMVICAAALLAKENQSGWGFLVLASVLMATAFWAWNKSQPDTDMHQAHATQIAMQNGTSITTDSRLLKSAEGLRGLSNLIQEMLSRQPLPKPDGLVDAEAKVIPNSASQAAILADKINSETQAATNSLIDALGLAEVNQNLTPNQNVTQSSDASNIVPDEVVTQELNKAMPLTGASPAA
ncbi:hypothetical protein [Sideroxyarcus sp. TK5]